MAEQKRLKNFAIAKAKEFKGKFPKSYKDAKYVYVEAKHDGLRGIIIVDNKGKAKGYTSSGVLVPSSKYIIKAFAKNTLAWNRVFDGEWFCEDWNLTQSLVKTQSVHKRAKELCIRLFDTIAMSEWKNKVGITPLHKRKRNLRRIVDKLGSKRLSVTEPIPIKPEDAAVKDYMKRACKAGHEGVMVKHPNMPYAFKRSDAWLKLKPKFDADLKIVGAELGTKGLAHQHHLGKLHLEGKIDGKKVKTRVGSGFKVHERKSLWKQFKAGKLISKTATITHEGVTVNGAVRFPEFIRIHAEK